jgi:hypothetical protein
MAHGFDEHRIAGVIRGIEGIPKVHWCGVQQNGTAEIYHVIIYHHHNKFLLFQNIQIPQGPSPQLITLPFPCDFVTLDMERRGKHMGSVCGRHSMKQY